MNDERIASVKAFVITIPRDVPYLGALRPGEAPNERGYFVRRANRTVYPTVDRSILVRVRTESGAVGWGETYGLISPRATLEILEDLFVPFATGRDPRDPAVLHDDLRDLMRVRGATGGFYGDALAGLDIAVWDVAARLAGLPLCRLLGGKRRDRVPGYVSGLPAATLEARVEMAAEWAARGFGAFKFAGAVSDEGEVAELRALRDRLGPEARIGIDLHWRYTAHDALALIARLAPYDPFFAEAPVASDDLVGLREVSRRSHVPIATGEEWYALADAAARLPGPAIVQPEMGHTGVTEFMRIAGLAEAHGAVVMPHATIGLGIFLAASLHASAALRSVTLHEYQHSIFDRNVRYLAGDLRMEETSYVVPAGPGLGVEPAGEVWRLTGR
ncbi:MAG TPA: mandelate racemase/muconate lactonizing enzyme family protein [Acetobacteraceae bacterium]|nr:mandelate racemase/muconate lactonizing enzyme family protein [Acetobacteraceae bacterium]